LFETTDDDEYDGDLGKEADEEEPVIRVRFHVKETKAPTPPPQDEQEEEE